MQLLKFFLGIGLAVVIVFSAASVYSHFTKPASIPADRGTLYQVSTIGALTQGAYDGVVPVGELKKHGDFGIGTFNALDGEMIVLDGIVYQAKSDGKIYLVPDNVTTPYAVVTYFDREGAVITGRSMNLTTFSSEIAGSLPSRNMVYAIRVHGTFPVMEVRAIPAQQKPYPALADAAKTQVVSTYTNTTGTVVGFYSPVFFSQLDVVGFHLHFISDDRDTGGHILDFTVPENTTVEYDMIPVFTMVLPTNGSFTSINLTQDVSIDLEKAEK
jgi:acetolactate decarboxylase